MKRIVFSSPLKLRFRGLKVRGNIALIIFCIVFFAGIVYGAVNGRNADENLLKRLDFIFQTNYDIRCSQGMLSAFVSSFASAVMFLAFIFLFGLSLWGGLLSWTVPFFKGYGYGLSVGFLYNAYGFYGVGYNLLVVLPGAFLSAIIISAAAQEALRNSVKMISLFTKSAVKDDPHIQMIKYLKVMMWFLLLCAVSAAVDMLFALCFSWIFKF